MAKIKIEAKVNLSRLRAFRSQIEAGWKNTAGPFRDCFLQWGHRYRAAMQKRFVRFSRGGGDWPPLAESTRRRRMGGRGLGKRGRGKQHARSGKFAILRDSGILFNTLEPEFIGAPGQVQEAVPFGVKVGIGGPAMHKAGKASVAQIARFHQSGGPRLPKREIIVNAPAETIKMMRGDLINAVAKAKQMAGFRE